MPDRLGSVVSVPLVPVGYDLVDSNTDRLELLSGNGALGDAVPEGGIVKLVVITSEGSVYVEVEPEPSRPPVPLTPSVVELPRRYGAVDDKLGMIVPEDGVKLGVVAEGALDNGPAMVDGDPIPTESLAPLTVGGEVELLMGYGAVPELLGEVPAETVVCPDGYPLDDDAVPVIVAKLRLPDTPVPVKVPPVGPGFGSEEFVIGNGVISLSGVSVGLIAGMEELVSGNEVTSLALGSNADPETEVTGMLGRPFVGPTTGAEEFDNGNGIDDVVVEIDPEP
jgi:hypothetical protein